MTFHLLLDERHFPSKIRKLHATQGSYLEQPAQTASSAGAASPGLAPTAETQQKHLVQVSHYFDRFYSGESSISSSSLRTNCSVFSSSLSILHSLETFMDP